MATHCACKYESDLMAQCVHNHDRDRMMQRVRDHDRAGQIGQQVRVKNNEKVKPGSCYLTDSLVKLTTKNGFEIIVVE